MAKALNDFSSFAQRVWAEGTIIGKQKILLEMVAACQSSTEKKNSLGRDVVGMFNKDRLDKFAADMMLRDTDKRIR